MESGTDQIIIQLVQLAPGSVYWWDKRLYPMEQIILDPKTGERLIEISCFSGSVPTTFILRRQTDGTVKFEINGDGGYQGSTSLDRTIQNGEWVSNYTST